MSYWPKPKKFSLRSHLDRRGALHVGEVMKELPFAIARFFLVTGVPVFERRGKHANLRCDQVLVCTRGQLTVEVHDGLRRHTFVLDGPGDALHLPPWHWVEYFPTVADTDLAVLCSNPYDAHDQISHFARFLDESPKRAPSFQPQIVEGL